MEFFRHCPNCGRRFHIKLESKTLARLERRRQPTKQVITRPQTYASRYGPLSSGTSTIVVEGKPIIIDVEEFQHKYKCGHCGHEWAEQHVEEHQEG